MRARLYARFPIARRFGVVVSTPIFTRGRPTTYTTGQRRSIVPAFIALIVVAVASYGFGWFLSLR